MITPINNIKAVRPFNFRIIDETLSASALPYLSAPVWLKQQNVTDVVNFRTLRDAKANNEEAAIFKSLGIKMHRIPSITAKPTEENVNKFLNLVHDVKAKNGKLHAHCVQGANRTGMYVCIYELLNKIGTPKQNVYEMMEHGFEKHKYSHLIDWIADFVSKTHI